MNGGLIDFQDNLQRGVQEYVTPSMLLQAANAGAPQAMHLAAGVGGQYPFSSATQAGFIQQQGTGLTGGVLCGPASYLHVNGVTYKPVEEPNSKIAAVAPEPAKAPGAARTYAEVVVDGAAPRMLSKREFQQAIDDRVKAQVQTYMRRQHGDMDDYNSSGDGARVSSDACYSAEELAARRVADLNAGMNVRASGKKGASQKSIQSRW